MPANTEIVDHTTYDLTKEYYAMQFETGVEECDGPYTERGAYERVAECLGDWKILKLHDERKNHGD
jgi:hypothetical protein